MLVSVMVVSDDSLPAMYVSVSVRGFPAHDQIDSMATMSIPGWGYGLRCKRTACTWLKRLLI